MRRGSSVRLASPGVAPSRLIPLVHVEDVERSLAFYRALGFEVLETYEREGWVLWASMARDGARITFSLAGEPVHAHAPTVLLYLHVEDLDALHASLTASGARPGAIVDGSPGPPREFRLEDPDGHVLMVAPA